MRIACARDEIGHRQYTTIRHQPRSLMRPCDTGVVQCWRAESVAASRRAGAAGGTAKGMGMTYPSEAGAPPGTTRGSDVADVAERAVEQAQQLPPAEERRERLLDLLSAVTDNLGEGIYALDTAGRVTFMNPAAEAMLGWTFADLRGRDMHAAIHFQHADGTPYPREHCPLLRVVGSVQVERVEDDTFTRSDGS